MADQKSITVLALGSGILNLTGLGLGYLYQKRWIRWGIHIGISLVLLTIAILTNASQLPYIWIPAFVLWIFWMAFDGWRLGRDLSPDQSAFKIDFAENRPWLLVAIPGALLILVWGALTGYYFLGKNQYQRGLEAYRDADCEKAVKHLKRVTTLYELTFNPEIASADDRLLECDILLAAEQSFQEGTFKDAIQGYQDYLEIDSDFLLTSYTENAIADSYLGWAKALMAEDDFQEAIDKFQLVLDQYPDSDAVDQIPEPLAESYLARSLQLWQSEKWEGAILYAATALEDYPDTPAGQQAEDQIAEIYLDWAGNLQSYQVYSQALENVELVIEVYSGTKAAEDAPGMAAEIYFEWASFLEETNYYQESIEKYQTLRREYPDFYSSSEINDCIKDCYLNWGSHSREIGLFNRALEIYQEFEKDYSQQARTEGVRELMVETKLEWAESLIEDQEFTQAMDKYTEIKETTSSEDLIATAEEGYQEALLGLGHDQGSEGSKIISETFKSACDGEPATSPAIGILEDDPARALSCTSEIRLDASVIAKYPGHFQYVVDKSEGYSTVQSCPYQAGHTLIRQQQYWVITLRSTISGNVYTSKKFYGSMPEKCQATEWFSGSTKYKYGTDPSMTEVMNWLNAYFQ
jgi:tetratricopeptide (TPR) repeat protein